MFRALDDCPASGMVFRLRRVIMNCNAIRPRGPIWVWVASVIFAILCPTSRADLQLPMLKSGTVVYSNVTVYSQTEHDLYINHAQGLGNIKISTLDDDSLRALGLKDPEKASTSTAAGKANALLAGVKEKFAELRLSLPVAAREPGKFLPASLPQHILAAIAAGVVAFYLFTCYCLALICRNAGTQPGFAIWLPVLQLFPLLRAAKMSGWIFLISFIPLVWLWWCLRIAKACGKSNLIGILLFIPGPSLLAFLYLAFSKGNTETEMTEPQVVKLDGLTGV
jgi:hypothetical protein